MVHWYISRCVSICLFGPVHIYVYLSWSVDNYQCMWCAHWNHLLFFLSAKQRAVWYNVFLPASHTTLIIAMKIYWTLIPVLFFPLLLWLQERHGGFFKIRFRVDNLSTTNITNIPEGVQSHFHDTGDIYTVAQK